MFKLIQKIAMMSDSKLASIFFSFAIAIYFLFSVNRFMDLQSDPSKFIGTIEQYDSYMVFSKIFYTIGMSSSVIFAILAFYFLVKISLNSLKR